MARLIHDAIPDGALLRCKLERETEPATRGKAAVRVVLANSMRSTPGEARKLQREQLDATGIEWQVVEA